MKNLINLFVIALLFFVTSCQKEEVKYSENPQAPFGEQHNEMLQSFLTNHGGELQAIQSPMEKEAFIINQIFEAEGENPELFQDAKLKMDIPSTRTLSSYDFTNYREFLKLTTLSSDAQQVLVKALDEITKLDPSSTNGLADIQSKIRDTEIEFFKNHQDTDDFRPAMIYLATLKSSANFWNGNQEEKVAGAKWWQVLLADAGGAVLGAGITIATGGTGAAAGVALSAGFSAAVSKNP